MSVRQDDTSAPVSPLHEDDSGNDDGRVGSLSRNRIPANRVYALHGLLLSGIELALTVGNAFDQNAFQLNSYSDLIFGGSVIIEAVGFAFAIAMALRLLLYPVAQGTIGVGVPAMVIVEALVVEGSVKDMSMLGFFGLGAQSACFLLFAIISITESPDIRPSIFVALWILSPMVVYILFFVCPKLSRNDLYTTNMVYSIFWAVPFVVEIAESSLLFTSGSISFVAYLLAVLDLVIIAPAASFLFVSVAVFLMQLFTEY